MRTTAHGAVVLMFLYDEKSAVDPRRAARYQCFYFGTRDEWEIPVNSHLECGHGVAQRQSLGDAFFEVAGHKTGIERIARADAVDGDRNCVGGRTKDRAG